MKAKFLFSKCKGMYNRLLPFFKCFCCWFYHPGILHILNCCSRIFLKCLLQFCVGTGRSCIDKFTRGFSKKTKTTTSDWYKRYFSRPKSDHCLVLSMEWMQSWQVSLYLPLSLCLCFRPIKIADIVDFQQISITTTH